MKLEEKLRQGLLGHLSEANTVVDITIASSIAREFSIAFSVFVAEKCFELFDTKTYYIRDHPHYDDAYTIEDILYLWENKLL
jgi:hypothetical protein